MNPATITNTRSTLNILYARTASGLYVPPGALPPAQPIPQPHLTRQMRRQLERKGCKNHCRCGQAISWGVASCKACAEREEVHAV